MNVTSFVQSRQYGSIKGRACSQKKIEELLESKLTKSFINKGCEISGKCRSTFIMKFSPDGTKVASTHGDHSVRVTEVATGKVLYTLLGHPRTPWSLAYHPSISNILASGCLAGQVRIWDLYGHGSEVWTTDNGAVVAGLAFHPTDRVLVIAAGNTIYFWDWTKAAPFARCSTNHEYERIRWIEFDNLGHTLYTGISNNTSVHREQLAATNVSNISDEAPPASNRQAHLSTVYSDLVNFYQRYQRERTLGQTGTSAGQRDLDNDPEIPDHPMNSGLVADLYPGVHDDDIVRPRSPLERSRSPRSNPQGTADALSDLSNTIASLRRNELLFGAQNPGSSVGAGSSQHGRWTSMDAPNSGVQLGSSVFNPSSYYSDTMSDNGLISEHGHSVPFSQHNNSHVISRQSGQIVNESSVSEALPSTWSQSLSLPGLNEEIEIPLEAVTGLTRSQYRNTLHPISTSSQTNSAVHVSAVSTLSTMIQNQSTGYTSSQNQSAGSSSTLNQSARNSTVTINENEKSNSASVSVQQGASNTDGPSSAASSNPQNSVPEIDPQSLLLSRYICEHSQTSSSSSSGRGRGFASIRERLQSSVPLHTASSSADKISYSETVGIPKVTVIMSSQAGSSVSTQATSDKGTSQTVSSGQKSTNNCNSYNIQKEGSHQNELSRSSSSVLPLTTSSAVSSSSHSSTTETIFSTPSTNLSAIVSTDSQETGLPCPRNSRRLNLGISSSTSIGRHTSSINQQTVVASTSSHTSLFQNIFHDSNAVSRNTSDSSNQNTTRSRSYLPSFQSQPHSWQNRTRYLSIMGPYLQSRGVNPSGLDPEVPASQNSQPNGPISDLNIASIPEILVRDSSDTENELSVHLSTSGAYFMPITEDQRRANSSASLRSSTRSSASTSRNAQDIHLSRQQNISAGSIDSAQGERSESASSQGSRSGSANDQRSRSNSQDHEIELVVDQNENYTTNRNQMTDANRNEEIVHRNYDSNNNSIHIAPNTVAMNSLNQRVEERNHDYVRLRDCFVSMTDQIEREMNDLNRRINALRDSFNESIQSLRNDRRRYETVDGNIPSETATNLAAHVPIQDTENRTSQNLIRNSPLPHVGRGSTIPVNRPVESDHQLGQSITQPPTLLETSLNTHTRNQRQRHHAQHSSVEGGQESQSWRTLQRHYLHPHYSTSILDDTINRPNNVMQRAINRAIAGAFMGSGEAAVAYNILNQTHRIQYWDFTRCDIPDISQSNINIVVPHCKLHNGASADISHDGTLLATFVPNHQGFPDNNILAVYSLVPGSRGTCLYTKLFGPNAVSVSISPCNNHILVCLAARRLSWVFTSQQLVAQIYRLEKKQAGEISMKHIKDVDHICGADVRTHVSGNSASWLPLPGQGIVYGTNRGDLNICRPGVKVIVSKGDSMTGSSSTDDVNIDSNYRRLFGNVPWRRLYNDDRVSISTQTGRVRRTAGTQTSDSTEQLETLV
ncbi:WD domain [Mactra antiquata]